MKVVIETSRLLLREFTLADADLLYELGLERIIGRAEIGNQASIHVLEKRGLTYLGEQEIDGYPTKAYQILRPFIQ